MNIPLHRPVRFAATLSFTALTALSLFACEKKSAPTTGGPAATGTTTASADGVHDVCKLLSNEEVGALIGKPIISSHRPGEAKGGESECDYMSKDEAIAVALGYRPMEKKEFLRQAKDYDAVPGIGEGAYENHGILTVLHKTNEITVIHGGSDHVEPQKRVAAALIKKLDAAAQGK